MSDLWLIPRYIWWILAETLLCSHDASKNHCKIPSMDEKEKKKLSESDICDLFISPAIRNAGWEPMNQIRREVTLTPGPVIVPGNMSSRNKKRSSPTMFCHGNRPFPLG